MAARSAASSRALLLSLLGNHWQGRHPDPDGGRDLAAGTATFVDLLGRLGVPEATVRATLNHAVQSGQLDREQVGRRAFYAPTTATRQVLADGARRLHHAPAVRETWDGTWTLLSFSLPESRRDRRHQLRTRLGWLGFAALRDGLWVAPGRVEVAAVADELEVSADVHAFHGASLAPTAGGDVVRATWDLDAIAATYRDFLATWDRPAPRPDAADDLVRGVLLVMDWRRVVLDDPMLPAVLLPGDWPALQGRAVFDDQYARFAAAAAPLFEQALDPMPAPASR